MKTFASGESEFSSVRVINRDGNPWFVGRDVCLAFGDSNPNRTLKRVEAEDRSLIDIEDAKGRKQHTVVINESGMYSVLFAMTPQRANRDGVSNAYPEEVQQRIDKIKRFKHWVTSDVLPSIRKHGVFAIDEMLNDPDAMIAALTALKEERSKTKKLEERNMHLSKWNNELQDQVMVQTQQIAEMRPKASYYDIVLNCKDLVSITVIAKDYGWSAVRMNSYLHDRKVQFRQGDVWLLYQKYAAQGYTSTKTIQYEGGDGSLRTTVHTYWTQKGRLFLYELLREDNIFPLIEQEMFEKQAIANVSG